MIYKYKWNEKCQFFDHLPVEPPSMHDLEGIHTISYLNELRRSCNHISKDNFTCSNNQSDTYLCNETWEAACISAGLVCEATSHVIEMELNYPNEKEKEQELNNPINLKEKKMERICISIKSTTWTSL